MNDQERPRRKRRLLWGNLAKVGKPPLTTPQWKDAVREQELRGPKKPPGRPDPPQ
jgi:hypothetical protein